MPRFTRIATAFYLGVIAAAWLFAWIFDHAGELFGSAPPTPRFLLHGVLLGGIIVALCHAGYLLLRPVRRATTIMAQLLGPLRARDALWLAALSGFGEELLFRGALWPHLGLFGSAVLFGILHTVPNRALSGYPIFAFLAGIVLGLLRERSGSVWPAVACHFTVNAINLVWLGRLAREQLAELGRVPRAKPIEAVASQKHAESEALPVPQVVDDGFPRTIWRYHVRVEPTGTDRNSLPECLEAEELAIFELLPREEVYEALRDGTFIFSAEFSEPFVAFPHDLSAISHYLFEIVTGIEVAERMIDEQTTDDVRAWKICACRGEWVKVPLLVAESEKGVFEVDAHRDDLEVIAAHWNEYPRWFQDGMRFTYPTLREL